MTSTQMIDYEFESKNYSDISDKIPSNFELHMWKGTKDKSTYKNGKRFALNKNNYYEIV